MKRLWSCMLILALCLTGLSAQDGFAEEAEETRPLADGLYVISSAVDKNYALDVRGGSLADRANVQLYKKNGTNAQKFTVTYQKDGCYRITCLKSGKVLDVAGGSSANRTNVQQYRWNGTAAQLWQIKDAGDGTYTLVSKCGGKVLDVAAGKAKNGQNIQIYGGNGTAAQKFSFSVTEKQKDTPYDRYGDLQVKGAALCGSDGSPVQLRGISTHGIAWYPQYINEKTFAGIRDSWKGSVIRLAMYTAEYNGYTSGGSQTYLKGLIDKGVKAASSLGLYVIIDWHILSDGNPKTHQKEAISFFTEMSKKYAGYGNVLYEICNEPNNASWADVKSYANAVIPVIRKNAPKAVILVGTPTWSQDVDTAADSPLTGYANIMYSLHFYAATHKDSIRSKLQAAHKKGLPVFVTEYGICDASGSGGIDTASAQSWMNLLDQYKISSCAWNLSNKAETSALLKASCTKTSGFADSDLSSSGKWIIDRMRKG